MEADLVTNAGVDFESIPAAGIHGVGLRRLPGNALQVMRGVMAARTVLKRFRPDVMFFTGGYVAVPMAVAGLRIPTLLYIPDIEPGLALKFLALFADRIAVTAEDSKVYFTKQRRLVVTGYPVRPGLSTWEHEAAYRFFGFSRDIPTLLVTGGSLGSLSINQALVAVLPELLVEMQIIHLTGKSTWSQFASVSEGLPPQLAPRYKPFPYLHEEMGAAFTIADLVVSRAGASSIGEYPHFGIPAILVPYPHAWRYQRVNAKYLARNNAAIILEDADLQTRLLPVVREIIMNPEQRKRMKIAMQALARKQAARSIANAVYGLAAPTDHLRN
jgi:UDP-N-acetylglucosamine:LPS N-acetylglucosamine transferase